MYTEASMRSFRSMKGLWDKGRELRGIETDGDGATDEMEMGTSSLNLKTLIFLFVLFSISSLKILNFSKASSLILNK